MAPQRWHPDRRRAGPSPGPPGFGARPWTASHLGHRVRGSSMRVIADLDLCQGHQMCQGEAPEVFGFDEAADRVTLLEEHPDEVLRPQVLAAVRYCPAMALALESDTAEER